MAQPGAYWALFPLSDGQKLSLAMIHRRPTKPGFSLSNSLLNFSPITPLLLKVIYQERNSFNSELGLLNPDSKFCIWQNIFDFRKKSKTRPNLKTGRFDNIDSAVIISSVSTILPSLRCMMTAESMLSKRPVLQFIAVVFFLLKLFLSHIYCIIFSSSSVLFNDHQNA